jgi:hypothetical protein
MSAGPQYLKPLPSTVRLGGVGGFLSYPAALLNPLTNPDTKAKLADSIGKQYDRLADLFGLNAPEPASMTTNNLLVNVGATEQTLLEDLARFREIKNARTP